MEELRLTQEGEIPNVAFERSAPALWVSPLTVDRELKEAVIQGNVSNIVASRLSFHFHAQTGCSRWSTRVGRPWLTTSRIW